MKVLILINCSDFILFPNGRTNGVIFMYVECSKSSFAANQENLMMLRAKLSKVALDEVLSSSCPVFTFFQTKITLQIGEEIRRKSFISLWPSHYCIHLHIKKDFGIKCELAASSGTLIWYSIKKVWAVLAQGHRELEISNCTLPSTC